MARVYPSTNKAMHPVAEIKNPAAIKKMNTAELTALAEQKGIDIAGAKNNAERADLIIAALDAGDE